MQVHTLVVSEAVGVDVCYASSGTAGRKPRLGAWTIGTTSMAGVHHAHAHMRSPGPGNLPPQGGAHAPTQPSVPR